MTVVKIAIQGCCHGELNKIYESLPPSVELLIICGDFQALRNTTDLETISMPAKYRRLGDFHTYYSGQTVAPVLTLFIGGNHESSSYMKELKYGGWVAQNIYYLGEFGSVWYKGLHISGWSGIFNWQSFIRNDIKDEALPYDGGSIRSIYHTKPKNYLKMLLLDQPDIMLSHDWPVNIEQHGNVGKLLSQKKFFREDIERNQLGSPLNKVLLFRTQPRYWFSAHLHVRFEAKVVHKPKHNTINESTKSKENTHEIDLDLDFEIKKNTDEIDISMDETIPNEFETHTETDTGIEVGSQNETTTTTTTSFLALDKCLPKRKHLEIIDISVKPENQNHPSVQYDGFCYSERSIAINRVVEDYLLQHASHFKKIDMRTVLADPSNLGMIEELDELVGKRASVLASSNLEIAPCFEMVAPSQEATGLIPLQYWENKQTTQYCKKFDIPYTKLRWREERSRSRSPRR